MEWPSPESLMLFVDLTIALGTIATVIYVAYSGALKSWLVPMQGSVLVLVGIALAVFAFIGDALGPVSPIAATDAGAANFVGKGIPEWLYWLLTRAAFLIAITGLVMSAWHRLRANRVSATTEAMIAEARRSIAQSEARYRYVLEATSNSVYCYSFDPPMPISLPVDEQVRRSHDAILTQCNDIFAKLVAEHNPPAVIGSRMGILDANKDTAAYYRFFKSFVENDYFLPNYELIYKRPDGQECALRCSLTGVVRDHLLYRIWGVDDDILEIRQTTEALARRRRYERLLADISSRLVKTRIDEADEAIEKCMQEICQYVEADRTTLIWFEAETLSVDRAYTWKNVERKFVVEAETLSVDRAYTWKNVERKFVVPDSLTAFPFIVKQLTSNKVVRIEDIDDLPECYDDDREGLFKRGVKSFVALPTLVDGELIGFSTYSLLEKKRSWTDQDVLDLQVFTELLATFCIRVRSRRALDDALLGLQRATDRLEAENVYLQEEIKRTHGFDEIVGQSRALLRCLHMVKQVADTMTPVLILGETGTGKELIARAIHEHSGRHGRPLIKVNCAALPASLIESELFGYEKGAFTGADRTKRGRFDLADSSTLFLDEIADIPLELQSKLLRVLQEGEIERLGGSKTIKVDVRIIAATNRNLAKAVRDGEFRSDLFYRINPFPIELPALRDRGDDVELLAQHFVKAHANSLGRTVTAISATMMQQLRDYSWPGNVRELDGVIQRALISSTASVLDLAFPLGGLDTKPDENLPYIVGTTIADLRLVERDHIVSELERAGWKISGDTGAASRLGVPPSTLRSKMKKLEIVRPH